MQRCGYSARGPQVWDYAGDNYVHRLIQSKTDGKLIEVASPGPAGGGGGGGGGSGRTSRSPRDSHGGASCQRRSHCGGHGGGGGECCDPGEEAFQQALIASKIDAVAAEYNHLLCSQLDSQRHYFEGLLAQQAEDAERRLEAAAKAASTSEAAAAEARGAAKEAVSKRQAAERKLADAQAAVAQAAKERDFLRSLSDNLLADKKEWAARLEAAQKDVAQKEAEVRDLKDQVHDLMMFIEAQKSIEALGAEGNELREASLLPVAAPPPQRRGKGKAASAGGSPAGASSGSKK